MAKKKKKAKRSYKSKAVSGARARVGTALRGLKKSGMKSKKRSGRK